jgi:hypothetical protein
MSTRLAELIPRHRRLNGIDIAKMVAFATHSLEISLASAIVYKISYVKWKKDHLHLVLTITDNRRGLCVSRFEETIKNVGPAAIQS